MALALPSYWYIRISGSDTAGARAGGVNPATVVTNYAAQDSAQVTFSSGNSNRLNCSDHTGPPFTVTSDGTPFTSAMVGNYIVILATGNWTAGYYEVTAFNSSSSINVDRDPTNGSNATQGTGALGGAFASPKPLCTTSTAGSPTITSPLSSGHSVYVEGSGSESPSTPTYTWSNNYTFPVGSDGGTVGNGRIKWVSTSGKIRLHHAVTDPFATLDGHMWQNFYWVAKSGSAGLQRLLVQAPPGGDAYSSTCWLDDCIIDQNGYGIGGTDITNLTGCGFLNSGEGAVVIGSSFPAHYGTAMEPSGARYGRIMGCAFIGWWAGGTGGTPTPGQANGGDEPGVIEHPNWITIEYNIFANCSGSAVRNGTAQYNSSFFGNVVYNVTAYGVHLFHGPIMEGSYFIRNNIFDTCGGYGIYFDATDEAEIPQLFNFQPDYNAYRNNFLGDILGVDAGANDVSLSVIPFVNAGLLDFTLNGTAGGGATASASGWPQSYIGTTT